VLFETNLDEAALVRLTGPAAGEVLGRLGLSEVGEAFFHRMIRESVAHLTEVVVTLPSFHQRSLRELLARDDEIIGLLRQVLEQMPRHAAAAGGNSAAELDTDYRREIIRKYDRVELFGVTVAGPTRRYPLDVAYLGLSVSDGEQEVEVGLDVAISAHRRLYIRGDAGSGKTTLLRWLALKCARGEHEGPLAAWSRAVPVMVELRRFAERDLPGPSEYLSGLSRSLTERLSGPWVDQALRSGRAVLLIDGVDEFPADRRHELQDWIGDLAHDYPQARMVVTSRPAATPADWLDADEFGRSDLMPMSRPHIAAFVRHWHDAIRLELGGQKPADEITGFQQAMISAVDRSRPLRMMATNPLLCALLCALNWDRRTQLPQRRIEIYRAALEMLLRRRDHERQLSPRIDIRLEYADRLAILEDLAYWFTLNGWADVDAGRLRAKLATIIENMPQLKVSAEAVYAFLMTRSGVLREPVPGRIDFIHKTFQEYLAAIRFVEEDAIESLLGNADRDDYHEVIVMAAGCARQHEAERLITALLDLAERPRLARARRARLRLLAVGCSEVTSRISRGVADRILHNLRELVPPTTGGAARILAGLGEDILPVLPDGTQTLPEAAAAATLNTAALVGGPTALRLIASFRTDQRAAVSRERLTAWCYFDPAEFARQAFGPNPDGWRIALRDPLLLPGLRQITDLHAVRCEITGSVPPAGLAALADLTRLESFSLRANRDGLSLRFLAGSAGLRGLDLERCAGLRDVDTIAGCTHLRHLVLRGVRPADRQPVPPAPGRAAHPGGRERAARTSRPAARPVPPATSRAVRDRLVLPLLRPAGCSLGTVRSGAGPLSRPAATRRHRGTSVAGPRGRRLSQPGEPGLGRRTARPAPASRQEHRPSVRPRLRLPRGAARPRNVDAGELRCRETGRAPGCSAASRAHDREYQRRTRPGHPPEPPEPPQVPHRPRPAPRPRCRPAHPGSAAQGRRGDHRRAGGALEPARVRGLRRVGPARRPSRISAGRGTVIPAVRW
jgi:hypothetical protein